MQKVKQELEEANEIYIDKKIKKRVEKEITHLGKEKLLVDHIYSLSKKFNKDHKNKALFLLVELYHLNTQVHQSLARELKNDKKLLNKRIKTKIDKNKVHIDLYKKLLKIADKHYQVINYYVKHFNPKKVYSRPYILGVIYHKKRAEHIYKTLINSKMKKILHHLLLKKLVDVYESLIEFTVLLANQITDLAISIKNNKAKNLDKKSKEMQLIVSNKTDVLSNFAFKYTYNVIHSDKFLDFDNNKVVLIGKKA